MLIRAGFGSPIEHTTYAGFDENQKRTRIASSNYEIMDHEQYKWERKTMTLGILMERSNGVHLCFLYT